MTPKTISEEMNDIQDAAVAATSLIRDDLVGLLNAEALQNDAAYMPVHHLCKFANERCQAIFMLVSHKYPWDAEIILRSYYETSVRLFILTTADENLRSARAREFLGEHDKIKVRKRAANAVVASDWFATVNENSSSKFMDAMSDAATFDFSNLNKRERARIEGRWSFSQIVFELDELSKAQGGVEGIQTLRHFYGTQSHFLHADATAIDYMIDRETRHPSELVLLECAHVARIYSDVVMLSYIIATRLARILASHMIYDLTSTSKVMTLFELIAPVQERFQRSQV